MPPPSVQQRLLAKGIAESVTMSDLPSESSFNGSFSPVDDMVVKDEGLIARTAFELQSKRVTSFHTIFHGGGN